MKFWQAFWDGSKSKIDNWSAAFMVIIAVLLDLVQLLLGLLDGGFITGPIIYLTHLGLYSLWFLLKGMNYWSTRAVVSKAISGLIEILPIPYLKDIVPGVTVSVVAAIGITRMEEAGVPLPGASPKGMVGNIKQVARKLPEHPPIDNSIRNKQRSVVK